jgi:hypothetical protein
MLSLVVCQVCGVSEKVDEALLVGSVVAVVLAMATIEFIPYRCVQCNAVKRSTLGSARKREIIPWLLQNFFTSQDGSFLMGISTFSIKDIVPFYCGNCEETCDLISYESFDCW